MKKNKKKENKPSTVSPEEAVQFLEDMRVMYSEIDEPTVLISIRIPGNILRAIKLRAKADGKKYQSLMIDYLRQSLRNSY